MNTNNKMQDNTFDNCSDEVFLNMLCNNNKIEDEKNNELNNKKESTNSVSNNKKQKSLLGSLCDSIPKVVLLSALYDL